MTAVHCNILQTDEFSLSNYEGKPSGKCGYFIDKIFDYRKKGLSLYNAFEKASIDADYYVGKLSPKILKKAIESGLEYYIKKFNGDFDEPGKEVFVLTKRDLDTVKSCISSIKRNKDIQKIVSPGIFDEKEFFNEMAVFVDIEVTFPNNETVIIPCKGKLDSVVVDHEKKRIYLNDIKTTSRQIDFFMGKVIDGEVYNGSFESHHYFRQLAYYLICLQMFMKEIKNLKDYSYECNIFAVETTGTHQSKRIPINQAYIDLGIKEFKDLICRVAYHQKYGFENKYPTDNI